METRTHIYTFEIETDAERAAIEAALASLSTELGLAHPLRLRGGHRGLITLPDIDPEDAWAAIERVVPDWQRLFMPRAGR